MKRVAAIAFIGAISAAVMRPTQAVSRVDELRTRLEAFAHDSMEGRQTGSRGAERAAAFLERELRRIGVQPAGENGTFSMQVPVRRTQLNVDDAFLGISRLSAQTIAQAEGKLSDRNHVGRIAPRIGFIPITGMFGLATPRRVEISLPTVYSDISVAGALGAARLRAAPPNAKAIAFYPPARAGGQPDYDLHLARAQILERASYDAILVATLDLMPRSVIERLLGPQYELTTRAATLPRAPAILAVTVSTLDELVRRPGERDNSAFAVESPEHSLRFSYDSREIPFEAPPRNIVAVIPGSDPQLRSEYVVLSAHLDHLGVAAIGDRELTDSIYNGADDGGSGSVALLSIAEAIMRAPVKPKRSLLFLWTVGHEQGFLGAEYFADHPVIPRDRIVANITLDGIAGLATDTVEMHQQSGSPADLIAIAEAANRRTQQVAIAHRVHDATICTGSDWHFGRYAIPSLRFTTGVRPEQHSVRDDVSGIDFATYSRVVDLIESVATEIASRSTKPSTDGLRSTPSTACVR